MNWTVTLSALTSLGNTFNDGYIAALAGILRENQCKYDEILRKRLLKNLVN
jgi:hypothetical protein